MIREYKGIKPKIHKNSFVAETAALIGKVTVKENANIWYGVVARADVSDIIIGERSNVQDNTVLHGDFDHPVIIGNDVTIGHNAVIHGCTIEDNVLIGMGAIILNGAVIKEGAVVAAGSLVGPGKTIDKGMLAMGSPAKMVKEVPSTLTEHTEKNKDMYVNLGKEY